MRNRLSYRSLMFWVTLTASLSGASGIAFAQHGGNGRPAPVVRRAPQGRGSARQQAPAPIERRAPGPAGQAGPAVNAAPPRNTSPGGAPGPRFEAGQASPKGHLGEWMNQHGNLTPGQQQQALEREPGFRQLPSVEQQRMRDRLTQLNAMPAQQRQRMVSRTEAMERLNPEQRSQVRGAMSQLGALPPDQRQSVARSFRELRELPPGQRGAAMNSPRYSNLNEGQRAALNNLIRVEPMLPPPEPRQPR